MAGAGSGIVIVSARRANADALAVCIRRRGFAATVIEPGEVLPDSDTVVLDLTGSDFEPSVIAGIRRGGAGRVIGVGDRREDLTETDAWVQETGCVDDLVAAITATARCSTKRTRTEPASIDVPVNLTPREEEVLQELLGGGDSTVMAGRLGISPQTFRTHVQNVLAKLGVNSRAQAAVWALQNGMKPAEPERRAS
jgi:two-component system, NarL family, nitrate/nitrite response regulator NarL